MPRFSWRCKIAEMTPTVAVREVDFGDGYSQAVPDGLNHISETWNIRIEKKPPRTALQIDAFLRARGGVEPFDWGRKGTNDIRVICRTWRLADDENGSVTVTATFKQVFY